VPEMPLGARIEEAVCVRDDADPHHSAVVRTGR
jgi:hypothetical protein